MKYTHLHMYHMLNRVAYINHSIDYHQYLICNYYQYHNQYMFNNYYIINTPPSILRKSNTHFNKYNSFQHKKYMYQQYFNKFYKGIHKFNIHFDFKLKNIHCYINYRYYKLNIINIGPSIIHKFNIINLKNNNFQHKMSKYKHQKYNFRTVLSINRTYLFQNLKNIHPYITYK